MSDVSLNTCLIGGDLIKKEYLGSGNYEAMATRTGEVLALIRQVRGE